MRVDPSTSQTPVALTQTDAATARASTQPSAQPAAAATASDPGVFAMTQQLSQLLAAVRSSPEVRPEAINSASAKLASGELDTPQAATDTATAILTDAVQPTKS